MSTKVRYFCPGCKDRKVGAALPIFTRPRRSSSPICPGDSRTYSTNAPNTPVSPARVSQSCGPGSLQDHCGIKGIKIYRHDSDSTQATQWSSPVINHPPFINKPTQPSRRISQGCQSDHPCPWRIIRIAHHFKNNDPRTSSSSSTSQLSLACPQTSSSIQLTNHAPYRWDSFVAEWSEAVSEHSYGKARRSLSFSFIHILCHISIQCRWFACSNISYTSRHDYP